MPLVEPIGRALEADKVEQALRAATHEHLGRLIGVDRAIALPDVPTDLPRSFKVALLELKRDEHQRRAVEDRICGNPAAGQRVDAEEYRREESCRILPQLVEEAVLL